MEFDYKILAKYIIGEITFEEQTSLVEWSQMSEENNLLLKKIVEARILKKFVLNNSFLTLIFKNNEKYLDFKPI